jgi:hypothetical protein
MLRKIGDYWRECPKGEGKKMTEYEEVDKSQLPGFVYLMDDGRDLKLGITRNIDNRLNKYITENPRLKCHDSFEADSFAHAEIIEKELIDTTSEYRTHGKEWCNHCDEVFAIWDEVCRKYAKRTYNEWIQRRSKYEIEQAKEILLQDIKENLAKKDEGKKWFHYKDHPEVTICHSDSFDGSSLAARKIAYDHCRGWMEEENTTYAHWPNEDLAIIKHAQGQRLFSKPNNNDPDSSERTMIGCAATCCFLLIVAIIFWVNLMPLG